MTYATHQIVLIRARIMSERDGEWCCAPVDRAGHDIENACTLTAPPAAIVTIKDAAAAIAKKRSRPEEEW